MKNLRNLVVLFLITLQANAQESAIVNFVVTKLGKDQTFTIFMNEINVGSVSSNENLQVKLLSTGRISIIALLGNNRITRSIDVEKGKEYYYELGIDIWWGKNLIGLFEDEKKGKEAFNSNEKTIVFAENVKNYIGKIGESDIYSRPNQGSGFLINDAGFILTNFHVIDGADKIEVIGIKGDFSVPFTAKLFAIDRLNDLALLKIESSLITFDNPPYNLADSRKVTKADRIFALGYPMENVMGGEVKVTDGIINSLSGYKHSISEFQISAAIQGGNSGGPLFNSNGQVIGIVSAKIRSDIADQVGYAIKSDYVSFFLEQSGITQFNSSTNELPGKTLSEQVSAISNYVYLIKTK